MSGLCQPSFWASGSPEINSLPEPSQSEPIPSPRAPASLTRRPTDWFIPSEVTSNRTDWELARAFVFTHLFGPLIAQPLWIYLYLASSDISLPLVILTTAICSFWVLPFVLRLTKNMWMSSLLSFQSLAMTSLYGAYHYGGFSSPFLPWLVVSLLLGLFYLSRSMGLVLSLFALDILAFLTAAWHIPPPSHVPLSALSTLGWLSITSATVYMTWMAFYYSRVVSLKSEMEAEAEQSRILAFQLEHARTVAEANKQARSRFFTKMSHELRTPLNIIIGYSELLREELEDRAHVDQNWKKDIGRISAAAKHLLSLVSHVLDSDLVERYESQINVEEVRLGELCDEIVANALPIIKRNDNRLVIDCSARDTELRTDARKLRQILINLLSNAGKFTSRGIVTLQFEVTQSDDRSCLRVLVKDTGVGIPPDALPRLFTAYEQGSAAVGASYGGTGLGLALSRQFCRLLGGDVSVISAPGVGSEFTVIVPARLAARDLDIIAPDEPPTDERIYASPFA